MAGMSQGNFVRWPPIRNSMGRTATCRLINLQLQRFQLYFSELREQGESLSKLEYAISQVHRT